MKDEEHQFQREIFHVSEFEFKKQRVPLEEQKHRFDADFDSYLKGQRRTRKRPLEDELEECTFQPATNTNGNAEERGVEDLFRWKREKDIRLNKIRMGIVENGTLSFQPETNKKSSVLVRGRKGNVYDRLYSTAGKKGRMIEERQHEEEMRLKMQKPVMNSKSKKILKAKNCGNEILKKVEIDRNEKCSYYAAVASPQSARRTGSRSR